MGASLPHPDTDRRSTPVRKPIAVAAATLMLASLASVSNAHHRDDHDANHHGLCTAAFSGSETGQEKKNQNGNAFVTFLANTGDYDEDGDVDRRDLAAFCLEEEGGFGNPGQGNDPVFFEGDDCEQDDPAAAAECEALADQEGGTDPGNSNGKQKP